MSHPKYWGKPYPQLMVIRANIKKGNYEDYGETIIVEYGWSDAMVTLRKQGELLLFENTIGST